MRNAANASLNRAAIHASWRAWWAYDAAPAGPVWLQWLWTLLFSMAISLLFTLGGFAAYARTAADWTSLQNWGFWYSRNLVVSCTIGFLIQAMFALILPRIGVQRIKSWSYAKRAWLFFAIPSLGVLIGWPLGVVLAGFDPGGWLNQGIERVLSTIAISALISLVFFFIFDAKARQMEAQKQAAQAQLRLLQGQIEPHFLFNTLANVLTLIDADTPKAKRMLEHFIDYLRCSLGNLRREHSTLEQELGMAQAYLELMQTRMGDRLSFAINVTPPTLRQTQVPPLLLQPLVENAIHHGLECCVDGGRIEVQAHQDGDALVIDVQDNGIGLQAAAAAKRPGANPNPRTAGNGMALDNLRARLASRYAGEASFQLQERAPQGVRATLRLPLLITAAATA
jgi:anti-sigma regulatory factor (Ser/Thr protein kinase)